MLYCEYCTSYYLQITCAKNTESAPTAKALFSYPPRVYRLLYLFFICNLFKVTHYNLWKITPKNVYIQLKIA